MPNPITIEVRPSVNLKTKEALFVSFEYDLADVEKIKGLETRIFEKLSRSWEVPVGHVNHVIALFQDRPIRMVGKANTKVEGKVSKVVQFDRTDVSGFQYKTNPFDHQVRCFEYAQDHPKFLLGDEQGLGKTKEAIDIAVARKDQFKHTLIVCGVNSVKLNWLREISIHSNEKGRVLGGRIKNGKFVEGGNADRLSDLMSDLPEFFLIINIEALRDEKVATRLAEMTESGVIGFTVIDEVHKASNAQSQQGKAIHNLRSFYKMALTGTPLMNKPTDLYNVLKWLDVERHSFYSFRNRYCVMGGFGGHEVIGYQNLEELRSIVGRSMLRRTKDEVLNLPEKIRSTEYVEMTKDQWKLYVDIKNEIMENLDKLEGGRLDNPLAQTLRCRQVTGNPSLVSSKVTESAKFQRLVEMIEEISESGQKAVIFSNWEAMTGPVRELLKAYNPAYITGSVKAGGDRDDMVQKFQNDPTCKVIIGTIGAMGTGLTLTAASYVIFLDKPWNLANVEQAEDRAHRIGTTGTVNVITLVVPGTVDERVENIIEAKGRLSKALIDGDEDLIAELQGQIKDMESVDYLLG